jgi:hypothetical protein
MQQHGCAVASVQHSIHHVLFNAIRSLVILPIGNCHIPRHIPVSVLGEHGEDIHISGSVAVGTPKPGPWVDPRDLLDSFLGVLDLCSETAP